MYLRHTIRKKDGKVHRYRTLVRIVRVGRRVIQQTVAQLGELDERGRTEARALARRLIGAPEEAPLFNDGSEHLTASVRLKGVRIERSRQFGEVYLALALWRGVGLEQLCQRLLPVGSGTRRMGENGGGAGDHSILRASELHIAEDWYRRAWRSAAAQHRGGQQGSALSRARSLARAQELVRALRRAVRGSQRRAALRRHEHLCRGPGGGEPRGATRLFPRSSPRLRAGVYRPCRDLRRLPARL